VTDGGKEMQLSVEFPTSQRVKDETVRMLNVFNPLLRDITSKHSEPDVILYHYTSPQATREILESGKIRASDARFLNDKSEINLTANLIRGALERRRASAATETESAAVKASFTSIDAPSSPSVFVSSFSAEADMLNQWRGYAPTGFALGFSKNDLTLNAGQCGYSLVQVVYDKKLQEELVDRFVDMAINLWSAPPALKIDVGDRTLAYSFAFNIFRMRLTPFLKHHAFMEEKEWRLVSDDFFIPRSTAKGSFVRGRYLIPYEEIPFKQASAPLSALKQIIIGPPSSDSVIEEGLIEALERNNYTKIRIIPSRIPFREE
jgi:hypothetical protein